MRSGPGIPVSALLISSDTRVAVIERSALGPMRNGNVCEDLQVGPIAVTHNRYFSAIELMTEALDDYFGEFEEPNEKLASLCSWEFSKYDENGNKLKRSEKAKNQSKKCQHPDA